MPPIFANLFEEVYESSLFSPDTLAFLHALALRNVHYPIVGGEAVIYYGYPRLTGDMDLFYENSIENAERLWEALNDFWGGEVPLLRRKKN